MCSGANGHLDQTGVVANDNDVTGSLSNSVSSLGVTCHDGNDVSGCVEMLPAAGGVDSDDDNENENDKPSDQTQSS